MKLTLGTGLQNTLIMTPLLSAFCGQSLNDHLFSQHAAAGRDAYETLSNNAILTRFIDTQDGSQNGTFLTKTANEAVSPGTNEYWWDDTTDTPGPVYTTQKAALEAADAPQNYTLIDWRQGTSDSEQISNASLSRGTYKSALLSLMTQFKSDFPNVVIAMGILHRHKLRVDTGWQAVREVQWEVIDELSYVHFGHEIYDIDLIDNVHLTASGNVLYGQRAARRHLSLTQNGSAAGTLGPRVAGATLKTDRITLDIAHDDGSDLTVPASPSLMRLQTDSALVTPESLNKDSASTLSLILPEGSAPVAGSQNSILPFYGAQNALASTNAAVIIDNAAAPMPLQSKPVTLSNADPLQALDNLVIYFDARGSAKTGDIQSIAKLAGNVADANDLGVSTDRPTYDSAAFANAGGIGVPDAITRLHYGPYTAGGTHSIGMIIDVPSTVPNGSSLIGFANVSGGVDNQASLVFNTAGTGRIAWDQEEDSTSIGYEAGYASAGAKILLLLEIEDTGTARLYLDDWSSPATNLDSGTNFDPRDDYAAWTYMSLFKKSTSNNAPTGLKLGAYFHTTDILTAAERSDIEAYWKERFNIS